MMDDFGTLNSPIAFGNHGFKTGSQRRDGAIPAKVLRAHFSLSDFESFLIACGEEMKTTS